MGETSGTASQERLTFSEAAGDALRYWEPRRLVYNAILLAVLCFHFYMAWPESKRTVLSETLLVLFILGVLANVAYCAAYAVDLFVQFSSLRPVWSSWRWSVLISGTAFAAAITHFFAAGIFRQASID